MLNTRKEKTGAGPKGPVTISEFSMVKRIKPNESIQLVGADSKSALKGVKGSTVDKKQH